MPLTELQAHLVPRPNSTFKPTQVTMMASFRFILYLGSRFMFPFLPPVIAMPLLPLSSIAPPEPHAKQEAQTVFISTLG